MSKTVVKFGGSNHKCKEDIGRVIQVVKNYNKPIVIVVSAYYGVTNFLIEALEKARHDEHISSKTINYLYSLKKETLLSTDPKIVEHPVQIQKLTYSEDFGILKLKGSGVGAKPGILAKVTTALHVAWINISSVLTSQISINILIAKKDLSTAYAIVSAIELPVVARLQIAENIAVPP